MKPLEGYLVIALEQAVAAPLCTMRLAEAGARVIKIERAGGDFARRYDEAAKGESSYFVWLNQAKESIILDLKTGEDLGLLMNMLEAADVFVQNLAPGAAARLGLGCEDLRKRNRRLITCDISGYGEAAQVRHLKAYDLLIQAESGLVATSGGETELGRIGVSICDIGAGMTAHAAIMEALLRRERTGEGAAIKISLFDVAAEWMTVPLIHHDYGTGAPRRQGLRHPSIAPYSAYRTRDGELTLLSIQNEREWSKFCEQVLAAPEMASDERFDSNSKRVTNREVMDKEILCKTGTLSADEFRKLLAEAGIAYGAVNEVASVSTHPALRRRNISTTAGDSLTVPANPVVWADQQRDDDCAPPPIAGNAADAIRNEFAGVRK